MIHISFSRMCADRSGQSAEVTNNGHFTVSWLNGEWSREQAFMALTVAEFVAIEPPIGHPYWRNVECFLTELGLDLADLEVLIDPEDDEEGDMS